MSQLDPLKQAVKAFFKKDDVQISPIGAGDVNATYIIKDGSDKWILQKLNPIFNESMAEDYDVFANHLRKYGWDIPDLIHLSSTKCFFKDSEGRSWRVFSYLDSDKQTLKLSKDSYRKIGDLLGSLHKAFSTLDYKPKYEIAHFHQTDYFFKRLLKLESKISSPDSRKLAHQILDAYKRFHKPPQEYSQLIHGDPRTANILFRDNQPYTFIDFDTVLNRPVWVDLGDLLRSFMEDFIESNTDIPFDSLRDFCMGYKSIMFPKTDNQKFMHWCQLAAQQIALELAMRFLNDMVDDSYFNWDNKKYMTRQDNHLARVKTQWQIYLRVKELA